MKLFVRIIQFLFGLTFVFSGWAKCVDPAGTAIKFTEYFQYFGMGFFADFAMGFAWVLSIVEFLGGFYLLFGHARYWALTLSFILLALFTPLTLWLALTNAIEDCGCFGDVVHLSNGVTFLKNVVLCVMLWLLWRNRKCCYIIGGKTAFTVYSYWVFLVLVWMCWHGTWREPLVDFRPFLPGTDLRAAVVGEGNDAEDEKAEVTYTCVYERDGVKQEFELDALPEEEEGWEFVETIEHVATATDAPKASTDLHLDFFARNQKGDVVTEQLLGEEGYVMLLMSPSLDKASQHDIDRIETLYEYASDQQCPFYCLTANDEAQLKRWLHNTGAEYPFLFTDVTIIQTIARSNPSLMLLHDGVICWKNSLSDIDAEALTSAKLSEQTSGQIAEINQTEQIYWLLILIFGPFVLFLLFEIPKIFSSINSKKISKDA